VWLRDETACSRLGAPIIPLPLAARGSYLACVIENRRRDAWVALLVLGGLFAGLTKWTWRKWPDLIVDYGAQLYMPWKISTGAVLFRDMAYLPGGPLSQYFNALLFRLFGVSFLTLAVANLVLLALLVALIYRVFYDMADQWTALAAGASVLCAFAFAFYTTAGIFNYVTPYSAEAVHALVISALSVWWLASWVRTGRARFVLGAGLGCGCVFLTKPDMFLALTVAVAAGLVLGRSRWRSGLALLAGAAMVAPAAFLLYFALRENIGPSLRSVGAAWAPLLSTSAADNPYYRWCLGLDTPLTNIGLAVLHFAALTAVVAGCGAVCHKNRRGGTGAGILALAVVAMVALSLKFNWIYCGRCLPFLCLAALLAVAAVRPLDGLAFLWGVWSLALLAKMGLSSRIWHYGFVLGMPAFLTALYLLLHRLPLVLEPRGIRLYWFRSLLMTGLVVGLGQLLHRSNRLYPGKTLPIGSGADAMLAYQPSFRPDDAQLAAALNWIETNTAPSATLAVLPQGAMLNYLARRDNPTRFLAWNPPELAAFGQGEMTQRLIQNAPDYLALLPIDYTDYGEKYFGVEDRFGGELMRWIDANYMVVWQTGHDWLKDGQFGFKILKRKGG
jgi:hypothetical protein